MARLTDLVSESAVTETEVELTEEEMAFEAETASLEESLIDLLIDLAETIDASDFDGSKLLELSEAITSVELDEDEDELSEAIKRNRKPRKKCKGPKCAIAKKRRKFKYSRRTGAQKAKAKKYSKMYARMTK